MRPAYLFAMSWLAAIVQVCAQTPPSCRTDIALHRLEHAVQARDDFFFWDDLDEGEADADLGRYLQRLQGLLAFTQACAAAGPEMRAIERQARTLLLQAEAIAHARRSTANREARRR